MNDFNIFKNGWIDSETECGYGSRIDNTKNICDKLPKLISDYKINSINDIGCGDLNWIKTILSPKFNYTGYDCFIRKTWNQLVLDGWNLIECDVSKNNIKYADLTICRDLMIHLPNNINLKILSNIDTKYLLATNYISDIDNNNRCINPQLKHSKLDLRKYPYNLGNSILDIEENYPNKVISLWKMK